MPISGPVVHRQLMDAYANAQARLEQERANVSSTSGQHEELERDRSEALMRLAEHYLPELSPEAVRNTWSEVRSDLETVLLRKEEHRGRVRERVSQASAKRQQLEAELLSINEQLDAAIEMQNEAADQVEKQLQQSADFVQLSDRAALAEAALERAEANLQEIDQDAARKLPGYDESSLFRYLFDRGYSTKRYTHRGLTRRVDRWLARHIDYNKAKRGYEFLKNTPEQMREIIAQDRQAFDTVMAELDRFQEKIAIELRLPDKIEAVAKLSDQRDAQLKVLDEATEQTETFEQELTELDDTRGAYYQQAIEMFRNVLEQRDTGDLRQRARETPEIADDQIVARVIGVDEEMKGLQQATEQRRDSLVHMQEMMNSLGRLIQRFRALQFDSARSQFGGSLDVTDELYRARDVQDVDDLWLRIRSAQRWGPTVVEQSTNIATHPMSQVLINAMAHAAGAALSDHARRAGQRHNRRR